MSRLSPVTHLSPPFISIVSSNPPTIHIYCVVQPSHHSYLLCRPTLPGTNFPRTASATWWWCQRNTRCWGGAQSKRYIETACVNIYVPE